MAEVAAITRVSKMTAYRMAHSGVLPAMRIGRCHRVPEQAVRDYLREAFAELRASR
ncbi:helix-turn-helix domain-containing protein [Nocardiopsis metallicus]|uniref:helix-turn-helix domain-containing protein n=1 Tax=Nocardiopsis metallicus TaxID=179819 RepID=UPI00161C82A4